jgi:XisI protein
VHQGVSVHYQLVSVGWKNSDTRIYGCVIHVDIIDEKFWVQHDGIEDAIADQLVEKGVPKKDIVLAYHAPYYPAVHRVRFGIMYFPDSNPVFWESAI